jgi:hypothetical protein
MVGYLPPNFFLRIAALLALACLLCIIFSFSFYELFEL